jgi:hypothetical protein
MGVRRFLFGLILFGLLLLAPLDHSWPYPWWIRVLFVLLVPTAAWFALKWIWWEWQPDRATEDRLARTLAGGVAGALIVAAVLKAQATSHFECSQLIQTRDGQECVGDYVRVSGADRGGAFVCVILGSFAIWFGMRAPEKAPHS